jgi:hypothetical protein
MLFALPGHQFPYTVMNRCLYLTSIQVLLVRHRTTLPRSLGCTGQSTAENNQTYLDHSPVPPDPLDPLTTEEQPGTVDLLDPRAETGSYRHRSRPPGEGNTEKIRPSV